MKLVRIAMWVALAALAWAIAAFVIVELRR